MSVRLDRIYTKKGDKGQTQLIGGQKISKGSLQVECYGTLDELNCHFGLARALASDLSDCDLKLKEAIAAILGKLQNQCFDLGCLLAKPLEGENKESRIQCSEELSMELRKLKKRTKFLETQIDHYLEELEPLNSFVLPGSSELNAQIHLARAVTRRIERILVRLQDKRQVSEIIIAYFNRLSDFLFIFARWISRKLGEREILWQPGDE